MKRMMTVGLTGADQFLLNRDPLAGERLNLGAWWGYQKILSRESFDPKSVRFRFSTKEKGWFSVLFGQTESGFSGVRFIQDSDLKVVFFESGPDGEILREVGYQRRLPRSRWPEAEIQVAENSIDLAISGDHLFREIPRRALVGRLGFSGGASSAYIDDIVVELKNGGKFEESFENRRYWGRYSLVSAIVVFLSVCFGYVIAEKKFRRASAFLVLMIWSMSAGAVLAFDRYYYSAVPVDAITRHLDGTTPDSLPNRIERIRLEFFHIVASLVKDDVISHDLVHSQGYPMERIWYGPIYCKDQCAPIDDENLERILSSSKKDYRILFSGSSQTVGAGAQRLEDTFFARIHSLLIKRGPVESLNIAVSGDLIENQFHQYIEKYQGFDPDLIVLNWSNNDFPDALERGLSSFVFDARKRKKHVLIVLEANSVEAENSIAETHKSARKVASMHGIPHFDLHAYLNSENNSVKGPFWWDYVHLTSLGQSVAAKGLGAKIVEILEATDGSKK